MVKELGVNKWVVKPFDPLSLLKVVKMLAGLVLMKEEIVKLIELLKNYTPGDLVLALEIKELCGNLTDIPLISSIEKYFETIMREGPESNTQATVNGFIKELNNYFAETTGEKKQIKSPEIKGYTKPTAIDDREVLLSFIQEGQDHLQNIEEKILALERERNIELVDDIFRSMHTIKSVSSFLGLEKIKTLSHYLETVLDEIREKKLEVSSELIDSLLKGADMLTFMIEELSRKSMDPVVSKTPVSDLESEFDISSTVRLLEETIVSLTEKDREIVTEEMIGKFIQESAEFLNDIEDKLLTFKQETKNTRMLPSVFRSVHTIKGNSGFLGFNTIESLCADMEIVLDRFIKKEKVPEEKAISVLLNTVEAIRNKLAFIHKEKVDEETPEEESEEETVQYKPLGETLVKMGNVTREEIEEALELQQRKLGEILTLAIVEGITFRVGKKIFSLPISEVIEFHKAEEKQITTTEREKDILRSRDEIIPIVKIYEVFDIPEAKRNITEGVLMIVSANGKKAAFLTDEIQGYRQLVMKRLPDYLDNIEGLSGCSILGNGEVSLIIDTSSILGRVLE